MSGQRYDRPLDHVFAIQDEVTQTVAASLGGQYGVVARAGREVARGKPSANLQAYELYLLGLEHKHRYTPEDNQKAQELLRKATEIAPNFARAYVGLAWAHGVALDNGWTGSRQQSLEHMLKALQTAIALDPSDSQAHVALGAYYSYFGDSEHGLAELEKAVQSRQYASTPIIRTGTTGACCSRTFTRASMTGPSRQHSAG